MAAAAAVAVTAALSATAPANATVSKYLFVASAGATQVDAVGVTVQSSPTATSSIVGSDSRKDVEALVTANQTAFQGMQSLAQKQGEMLRATLSELQALASSGGAPSPQAAELVQQTLHKALANMQQLAQAAYQSQAESYAVIQKRVEENVEELRTLMQQKK